MRWTVDEPEDFQFVTEIYRALYPKTPDFKIEDILNLLDRNPDLLLINNRFKRNEGLQKSLNIDKQYIL